MLNIVVEPIPWIPLDLLGTQPVEHAPDGTNTVHFFDSAIFFHARPSTPRSA